VASNGTVQAKTWNPNGLAAVANLPCGKVLPSVFCFCHSSLTGIGCPSPGGPMWSTIRIAAMESPSNNS
jgi:hypothetical protein